MAGSPLGLSLKEVFRRRRERLEWMRMEDVRPTLENLIARAQEWMVNDPDPTMVDAVQQMLLSPNRDELLDHFGETLSFGTAGMRGALGPGPNRMNRQMACIVSAGLGNYLGSQGCTSKGVVIGFDGRHGSRAFARDAATVLANQGIRCWLYPDVVPTPELAHAVVALGADAGVMVTASHNPPSDNGYKVYWSNGAQIISPHDTGIASAMACVGFRLKHLDGFDEHCVSGRVAPPPPEMGEDYVRSVLALRCGHSAPLRIVYTPMHGVGRKRVEQVLGEAGYDRVWTVPEQAEPDPDFSTVAFPNPEEPHALDLAMGLAQECSADVIIANDPDADRLAVCVPTDGGWRQLTGNEVGVLLADELLSQRASDVPALVATTIVSTPLLADIAKHYGVSHVQTLTGFKWIANQAVAFDKAGGDFVIGFEEALGYCIGSVVRDKDGISAALVLCDLVSRSRKQDQSLLDRLAQIYRRHGLYASGQVARKMAGSDGSKNMRRIMRQLRTDPPANLMGQELIEIRDALNGEIRDLRTGEITSWELPKSNVLGWVFADGTTLLARPSGTEPKIKFYAYVREAFSALDALGVVEARAQEAVEAWLAAMVKRAQLD